MEKTYMDDIDRTIFPYVEYPGYPFRYPTHLPLVIEKKQADLLRRVSAALYAIFAKAVRRFQSQRHARRSRPTMRMVSRRGISSKRIRMKASGIVCGAG